MKLLFQGESVI